MTDGESLLCSHMFSLNFVLMTLLLQITDNSTYGQRVAALYQKDGNILNSCVKI